MEKIRVTSLKSIVRILGIHESIKIEYKDAVIIKEHDEVIVTNNGKSTTEDFCNVDIDFIQKYAKNKNFGFPNKKNTFKKQCPMKKSKPIKVKPRKVKKYDYINIDFMVHVKNQPCIECGFKYSEAHHVFGRQPFRWDHICVPLCKEHHTRGRFSAHGADSKQFYEKNTKNMMYEKAIDIFRSWDGDKKGYEFLSDIKHYSEKDIKEIICLNTMI